MTFPNTGAAVDTDARTAWVALTVTIVNEHLMEAVLWAAVFFETSGDDECDPDLAVKQLEQMAHALRQLSPGEQEQFRAFVGRAAACDPRPEIATLIPRVVDGLLAEPQ